VYATIAASNSFFSLIRAFLFAYGGICAAKSIHGKLLRKPIINSNSLLIYMKSWKLPYECFLEPPPPIEHCFRKFLHGKYFFLYIKVIGAFQGYSERTDNIF